MVGPQSFIFHLTASLEEQARALVTYAQSHLSAHDLKVAILSSEDGAGLNIAGALGRLDTGRVGALSLHLSPDRSMADVVAELRRASVGLVFYDGGPSGLAALAAEAARTAWTGAILTTSLAVSTGSLPRVRSAAARVFVAYPLLGSDPSPQGLNELSALQGGYAIPVRHLPLQVPALTAGRSW